MNANDKAGAIGLAISSTAHGSARITQMSSGAIVDLYERHARDFDRNRGRSLWERAWLDRFLSYLSPASAVLDTPFHEADACSIFL
jgi:hypothetical protein